MNNSFLPRWLAEDDAANPFNVEGFDCLAYVRSMRAVTQDPEIAELFLTLRQTVGAEYKGELPEDSAELACDLRYGYEGEVAEGILYKSSQMEEKWDVYLYGDRIYFCRSWTGALLFVAEFSTTGTEIVIRRIWAAGELDDGYAAQQVDYLIKSHLYGLAVPHPLPRSVPREPEAVGSYSFSQYGSNCCFATYEDTTRAG